MYRGKGCELLQAKATAKDLSQTRSEKSHLMLLEVRLATFIEVCYIFEQVPFNYQFFRFIDINPSYQSYNRVATSQFLRFEEMPGESSVAYHRIIK